MKIPRIIIVMNRIWFCTFLFFCTGCAYLNYLRDPFFDIPVFGQVNANLYRGDYPKPEGYERLKKLGIKTIINLSDNENWLMHREKEIAARYGFNVIHIPLSVYTWPPDEKVLEFLKTVLTKEMQPVFVHCSNGRDVTGAMIAVYRTVVEGWPPKVSYKEALAYGFWPYKGEVVLKKYIHQLKDRKTFYEFAQSYKTD